MHSIECPASSLSLSLVYGVSFKVFLIFMLISAALWQNKLHVGYNHYILMTAHYILVLSGHTM